MQAYIFKGIRYSNFMVKDSDRITLIAVILAIFFGVLQTPIVTGSSLVVFSKPLQVIAQTSFNIVLIWFLTYFVGLGMYWYYKKVLDNRKMLSFLYDTGIVITASIILMTVIIYLGQLLDAVFKTSFIIYIFALVSVILSVIITFKVIQNYVRFKEIDMNKLKKWLKRIYTAIKFSAIVGVTYWATTEYELAFKSGHWWMGILAFILVAAVLLIFGGGLLDAMSKD